MSRPATIADVTDRFIRFADFEVDKIVDNPKLLKAYTAMIEAVTFQGGEVSTSYGSRIEMTLPRNKKQLEEQLRSDQYSWDDKRKGYLAWIDGEEVASYRQSGIKEWAKDEGLPDPSDGADSGWLTSEEQQIAELRASVPVS